MQKVSFRHCLGIDLIDRKYYVFGTPPFSPHWSGEVPAIMGVVGTLGTADTGGTSAILPISVDQTTGAMYVNNIGAAGGGTAGTNVNIITGTINSGTIVGNSPSGASDSGNPVKIGGVYNSTQPTVITGQRIDFQTDNRGNHMIYLATKLDAANDAITIGSQVPVGTNIIGNIGTVISGTITGGTIQNLVSGTINSGTVVNNGGSVQLTDNTNIANIVNVGTGSNGTSSQNALITAGGGYTTGTITLGTATGITTSWYDMLNFSWVSVQFLSNSSLATGSFQTSGDAASNITSASLQSGISGFVTSTTTSSLCYSGPRYGRYFRLATNLSGTNTISAIITFFTNPSAFIAGAVNQNGLWNVNGTILAGTLTNLATGTINALASGTISAGTFNAGTITLNSKPGSQILTYGTATAGTIGTLVPAAGVGTAIYITSYVIDGDVSALGTPDIVFGFGTVQNGSGVIFRGGLPTTTPFGQTFNFPVSGNLTNTPLTFMQLSGGGTIAINVSYFVQ